MKEIFTGFLFLMLCGISSVQGQESTGTVRGFVYDKSSGEPILFTNVFLKGTTYGASTDVNGFFSISRIPAGTYTLISTYLGYDTASVQVTVKPGGIVNQKLFINKSSIQLRAIEVSAEKQEQLTAVKVSVETVTAKQITQIVSVGGDADIAQYLQVLPGVVFTGDQGGQLYIRGGSPVQNKVMLDGMIIYNPFHSIGLFSVFETDIIKNADVYTGGYNANHGGRISAVMDVTTRDGNQKRLTGKIGASPFMSRVVLEGPLSRPKNPDKLAPTFVIAGKSSYLNRTSPVLYSYADSNGLPFSFNDIYAKTTFKAKNGSKLSLFGFNFNDRVNFRQIADIGWNSLGLGANFVLIPEGSTSLISGTMAYSDYQANQTEADGAPRQSGITGFNGNINITQFLGGDEVVYGVDVVGFGTNFRFTNPSGLILSQDANTTELAAYVKYKYLTEKLVLEPGFRIHAYSSLGEVSLEPRLGAKYNLTKQLRLKFAGGLYSQNLISAQSDRDIVNLFYGFLSGPDNLPRTFDGQDVTSKLQKARHAIAGVEFDLGRHLEFNVETYIKDFNQLTNINRDKIYEDILEFSDKPDFLKKDYIIERGQAYGFDFRLKYDRKRFYFWATYSWTYVDRFDGIRTYNPSFDRRHNINLVSTYTFGKDLNWELSGRWNFGSGFPFTQTQGFHPNINVDNGINTDFLSQNGGLGIVYADFNQGRLPTYHRLDVSLRHTWAISDRSELDFNFSISNMYNRENIFYFDRVRFSRVNQLPILPSLGVTLSF
ncbi:MAG: TonB-dependent receptor [Sphingobacteriaceae bacterium]|nr:TonB-dependent receptor [Sphingobacteriaceae bacterium]